MKKAGYILGKIGSITTVVSAGLLWLIYLFLFLMEISDSLVDSGFEEAGLHFLPYTLTLTTALGIFGIVGAKKAKNGKRIGYYFLLISGALLSLGTIIVLRPPILAMSPVMPQMMPAVVLTDSIFYIDPQITILGAIIGLLSTDEGPIISRKSMDKIAKKEKKLMEKMEKIKKMKIEKIESE